MKGVEYVSAAPTTWLDKTKSICLWPRNKNMERKAINFYMKPEADWIKLDNINIVGFYGKDQ